MKLTTHSTRYGWITLEVAKTGSMTFEVINVVSKSTDKNLTSAEIDQLFIDDREALQYYITQNDKELEVYAEKYHTWAC